MILGCLDTPAGCNSLVESVNKGTKIEFLIVTLNRCLFVFYLNFTFGVTDLFPINDPFILLLVP